MKGYIREREAGRDLRRPLLELVEHFHDLLQPQGHRVGRAWMVPSFHSHTALSMGPPDFPLTLMLRCDKKFKKWMPKIF